MKFIFILGYQQGNSEKIDKTDPEILELMRANIKNNSNDVFFLIDGEKDKEASYIPNDVINRMSLCPKKTYIIYLNDDNNYINLKTSLQKMITYNVEEIQSKFQGTDIFNFTKDIKKSVELARNINEHKCINEKKIIIH